jgi:threonine dehydrogenase-like Zn-dependent dehydrogenase
MHRWSKPRLWRTAIELQAAGTLNLIPLITDAVPFADAPVLFDRLDRGEAGTMQSVLEF